MTHLMQIEAEFLSSAEVSQSIDFGRTLALANELKEQGKKNFDKQLKLAVKFNEAMLWFRKPETKTMLDEAGIEWSTEKDFVERVFGWNYTSKYHNKLMRVADIANEKPDVVTKFKRACTMAENDGRREIRTIAKLEEFANDIEQGDEDEKPEVSRPKTYASFSIAKEGINGEKGFSARLTTDGIVTSGELDEPYLNGKVTDLFRQMEEVLKLYQHQGVL